MKAVPAPKTAWLVLAAALGGHVLLISLAARHRADTSLLRALLLEGLAPLEKIVDRSLGGVTGLWTNYVDLRNVHVENAALRAENSQLRMLWIERREEILEAARLRRVLGFADSGVGRVVVSRIIGKDAQGGRQTIRIDRGSSSGIERDSSVITPDGVAGRVVLTSKFASIVQTIIDAESAVGVLVGEGRQQGLVKGNGSRYLELDYIEPDDSNLREGDTVLTSGLDGFYQKGYPVGTIVSIGPRDDGGHIKKVLIQTAVDFGKLEEVLCVVEHSAPSPADDGAPAPAAGGEPPR